MVTRHEGAGLPLLVRIMMLCISGDMLSDSMAIPALGGLLLGGIHSLVPLAQLAQLRGAFLGDSGSLGLVPQALVLQALLQLQDARLSSARH